MTATEVNPDTIVEPAASTDEFAPVITSGALTTSTTPATAVSSVTPEPDTARRGARSSRVYPFYTGWCGPGPCRDGYTVIDGVPLHRCQGMVKNGPKAPRPFLYCACECHQTNPNAVPVDPALLES